MKIETNKCISPKILREILELSIFDGLWNNIALLSFKKPKGLIGIKTNYPIVYNSKTTNKRNLYIPPYWFYNQVSKRVVREIEPARSFFRPYTFREDFSYCIYYNIFLHSVIDVFRHLAENFLNTNFLQYTRRDLPIKKDNTDIYKHFGGVENFFFKHHIKKMNKACYQARARGERSFAYYYARYSRIKFTGFKGVYTAKELYEQIIGHSKIITEYSFKKFLDNIKEPIMTKNKFGRKQFYFYTDEHRTLAIYHFKKRADRIISKQDKLIDKLLDELFKVEKIGDNFDRYL